jgi:CO/xanthine dehydrogenase Mo-binding subunit
VQAAEAVVGTIGTVGSYTPPKSPGKYKGAGVGPSPAYSYSAAVAEVEVDPATGVTVVKKVWMAHDVGQSINPVLVIGQVEGSVYMGLGEALMEEMVYREAKGGGGTASATLRPWSGVHKFPSLLEYKSPTTLEMCDVETILIEDPDPNGPFGAKEVGQGPLLPIPPAIANAVYDAVKARVDEIPITPEKVLRAMRAEGRRFGPKSVPVVSFPDPLMIPPPWEGGDGKAVARPKSETASTEGASS